MTEKQKNQMHEHTHFCKIAAAFRAAVALIRLTSSDVWEISNVNWDAAVSLCQSGHHQWHLKLTVPSLGGHCKV